MSVYSNGRGDKAPSLTLLARLIPAHGGDLLSGATRRLRTARAYVGAPDELNLPRYTRTCNEG